MFPFINNCPSPSYFLNTEDGTPSDQDPATHQEYIARRINDSIDPSYAKVDQATLNALDAYMEEIETTSGLTFYHNEGDLAPSYENFLRSRSNVISEESKQPEDVHLTPSVPKSSDPCEDGFLQAKDEEDVALFPQPKPPKSSNRALRKRKLDPEYEDDIPEEAYVGKKQVKPNNGKARQRCGMVQNYKGVTSRGWARVLDDPYDSIDSGLYQELYELVSAKWTDEKSLRKKFPEIEDLFNEVLEYVRKKIRGKVIKKSGNNKESEDSKVGNAKKIQEVFYSCPGDSDVDLSIKEVLRNHFSYFFDSKYYFEWLFEDCRAEDSNKTFLLVNAKEFKKVFSVKDHRPTFHNVEVRLSHVTDFLQEMLSAGAAAFKAQSKSV